MRWPSRGRWRSPAPDPGRARPHRRASARRRPRSTRRHHRRSRRRRRDRPPRLVERPITTRTRRPTSTHIGRALGQQRIGQRAVDRGDRARPRRSQARLGGLARGDRVARRLQQRLVVEQRQVRVEDLRLGGAGSLGDRLAVALDRGAGGRDRAVQQRALGGGVLRRRAGGGASTADRRDRAGRADRDARPRRRPRSGPRPVPEHRWCGCGDPSTTGCRRLAQRALPATRHAVAEPLVGQRRAAPRPPRLAPGPDAVTTSVSPQPRAERHQVGQRPRAHRRAVGAGLGHPHARRRSRARSRRTAPPAGRADRSRCGPPAPRAHRRRRRLTGRRLRRGAFVCRPARPSSPARRAPRLATSSSDAPPAAATAAATAPSTSGASLSRTGPAACRRASRPRTRRSSARCPRSISTSTPSADIARSIAARHPLGVGARATPGSSIPPAASSASSGAAHLARQRAPRPRRARRCERRRRSRPSRGRVGALAAQPVGAVQVVDRVHRRPLGAVRDLPAAGLGVTGHGRGSRRLRPGRTGRGRPPSRSRTSRP